LYGFPLPVSVSFTFVTYSRQLSQDIYHVLDAVSESSSSRNIDPAIGIALQAGLEAGGNDEKNITRINHGIFSAKLLRRQYAAGRRQER